MLGGYTMGMIAHIMMGVIVFLIAYFIGFGYLPGSPIVKGLIFGTDSGSPLLRQSCAGFLIAHIGGIMAVIASLMGHLVYGGLPGALTGSSAISTTA